MRPPRLQRGSAPDRRARRPETAPAGARRQAGPPAAGAAAAGSEGRGRVETGRFISRKLTEECPKHFVESCVVSEAIFDSTKCFGHSSVSFREMTDLSRPVSTLRAASCDEEGRTGGSRTGAASCATSTRLATASHAGRCSWMGWSAWTRLPSSRLVKFGY